MEMVDLGDLQVLAQSEYPQSLSPIFAGFHFLSVNNIDSRLNVGCYRLHY